jgi:hypothetical protein
MTNDDWGPLPVETPQQKRLAKARLELNELLYDWSCGHGLSLAEQLALLTDFVRLQLERAVLHQREDR